MSSFQQGSKNTLCFTNEPYRANYLCIKLYNQIIHFDRLISKLQLRQHWWKWYNYAISFNLPIKIDFTSSDHWICQDFSWKCELYHMWCLNLVCSVISQLKRVNLCTAPVIWFLSLKRDEVCDFIQFNTQFQRDKPQIFTLSRKTGYKEKGERNSPLHSKSQFW